MAKKRTIDKDKIIELRKEGKPFAEIARLCGCSDRYAWRVYSAYVGQRTDMRNQQTREDQENRQRHLYNLGIFDRLAFLGSESAADADTKAFKLWAKGEMDDNMLCCVVAYDNYLDLFFPYSAVPWEIMDNELKILGWKK